MVLEFTYQPKWDPVGFDPQPFASYCVCGVSLFQDVKRKSKRTMGLFLFLRVRRRVPGRMDEQGTCLFRFQGRSRNTEASLKVP